MYLAKILLWRCNTVWHVCLRPCSIRPVYPTHGHPSTKRHLHNIQWKKGQREDCVECREVGPSIQGQLHPVRFYRTGSCYIAHYSCLCPLVCNRLLEIFEVAFTEDLRCDIQTAGHLQSAVHKVSLNIYTPEKDSSSYARQGLNPEQINQRKPMTHGKVVKNMTVLRGDTSAAFAFSPDSICRCQR